MMGGSDSKPEAERDKGLTKDVAGWQQEHDKPYHGRIMYQELAAHREQEVARLKMMESVHSKGDPERDKHGFGLEWDTLPGRLEESFFSIPFTSFSMDLGYWGYQRHWQDWQDRQELLKAASNGDVETVKRLIQQGVDVNCSDGFLGATPLHHAASGGHVGVADLLLKAGARVDKADRHGDTPLHHAASGGHVGVAELLLKAGARVDRANSFGDTPLHYAASGGHVGVAKLLLKAGARMDRRDGNEAKPLHCTRHLGFAAVLRSWYRATRVEFQLNKRLAELSLNACLCKYFILAQRLMLMLLMVLILYRGSTLTILLRFHSRNVMMVDLLTYSKQINGFRLTL